MDILTTGRDAFSWSRIKSQQRRGSISERTTVSTRGFALKGVERSVSSEQSGLQLLKRVKTFSLLYSTDPYKIRITRFTLNNGQPYKSALLRN